MNYIGSKYSLLPFLETSFREAISEPLDGLVLCDLFAGTGAVGSFFKDKTRKVIANDWEYYSYVLNRNYIGNDSDIGAQKYIDALNNPTALSPGFVFEHYSESGSAGRLYFSKENGILIDTARQQIEAWRNQQEISEDQYFFLLASLLEAADKVANTASVYGAFLKKIKSSAAKRMNIVPAKPLPGAGSHEVHQKDSNALIRQVSGDILYLDPPYNSRQYGANYHLLNTIATYKPFVPKGKTGLNDYLKSDFSSSLKVKAALNEVLEHAAFRYIFLSYNNEGLLPAAEIRNLMEQYGNYALFTKKYSRFKADKTENRNHKADSVEEQLHLLIKS